MAWSKALVRKFEAFGGEILYNAKVKEILVARRSGHGVRAEIPAGEDVLFLQGTVVSNIPAQHTFRVIDRKYFPADWVDEDGEHVRLRELCPLHGSE